MEERDNKTIMCSVLFLDIVEYSKKSVSGQISLKDRFNSYLSAAIRDVPATDRIILDTGDGAAINFLGDIEDALKAALSLRSSLLNEDINIDPPLLVRMGINLGPVRLVRDINGQPNIVGDGINVAQRVMGFADVAQILVSRSYFDAVSRLSPQYSGMFHHQGSRTDKHVREHEVYAIGYPGDKTTLRGKALTSAAGSSLFGRAKMVWCYAASKLDLLIERSAENIRQAGPMKSAFYIGATSASLILIVVLLVSLVRHNKMPAMPISVSEKTAITTQPASSVAVSDTIQPDISFAAASAVSGTQSLDTASKQSMAESKPKPKMQKAINGEISKDKIKLPDDKEKTKKNSKIIISSKCKEAEVFVDGVRKGKIGSLPRIIEVPPGKHAVIVSHEKSVHLEDIEVGAGKTVQLKPKFCN